jgi:hypothetical protein
MRRAGAFGKVSWRRDVVDLDLAADVCKHIAGALQLAVGAWEQPHERRFCNGRSDERTGISC